MEVAKDRMPSSFTLEGSSPSSPLHFLNLSSLNPSSSSFYLFEDDNYPKQLSPNGEDDQNTGKSPSPPLSSSSSANYSNGFGAQQDSEFADNSLLGFKATQESYGEEFVHKSCGSNLVSFLPQGSCPSFGGSLSYEEYPMWEDSNNQLKLTSDWVYGDVNESPTQHSSFINNKRHLPEEENEQTLKKRCTSNGSSSKKQPSKPKSSTFSSKDPQSLAAKNRRERISERLKILQDLVPNGCKVDLVTMLDKAISYVKFLQLQVKVLATDEFWPVEGGKPPNISQVREAIDAILSSQRDSPSSLSNEMNV